MASADFNDQQDPGQNFGLSHRQLKISQVEMEASQGRHLQTIIANDDASTPLVVHSKRKTIQATVWASHEHPLSISTFLPLLNVLSFSSKQVRKLCKYLTQYQLPHDSFPVSASVPLFLSMEANFNFRNLKFTAPPPALFDIDQVVEKEQRAKM